jgi:diguanylate cyclase (GGDEF)-like protein
VIIAECRQSDVAGRLGGDEFVVLLPHTGPVEAAAVAQRLRRRFDADARAACGLADDAPPVGLSIGVASRLAHGASDPAAVLNAADAALYQAKRAGRDVVRVASMSAASAASIRRAG